MPTTLWTREHVRAITEDPSAWTPVIPDEGLPRVLPGYDFWDLWPVRTPDGALASVCGREVWGALTAPAVGHPATRHDIARIRLVARRPDEAWGWDDLGPLFPDGASAGFAGVGRLDAVRPRDRHADRLLHRRGRPRGGAPDVPAAHLHRAGDRRVRRRSAVAVRLEPSHARRSSRTASATSSSTRRTASRDSSRPSATPSPSATRRPARTTCSSRGRWPTRPPTSTAASGSPAGPADGFELLDPLVTADGVNNELERAHVSCTRAATCCSSRRRPDLPPGLSRTDRALRTGRRQPLRAVRALERVSVILINPPTEPFQAYSWVVLPDLTTTGFVDSFALHGRHPGELESFGPTLVRRHFGGTMTGVSQLRVDGIRAWVEQG